MNHLFSTLGWCVLQVTLVSLAAWILCLIVRGARVRHDSLIPGTALASILILTAIAFLPLPANWAYRLKWADSQSPRAATPPSAVQAAAQTTSSAVAEGNQPTSTAATDRVTEAPSNTSILSWLLTAPDAASVQPVEVARPKASVFASLLRNWQSLLCAVIAASVLIGIFHLLGGLLAIRSYRRCSRPITDPRLRELMDVLRAELKCHAAIELRETSTLTTAATFGWWGAVILLPTEWTKWTVEQQRAVLAHEIAHVVRGDFLACMLAQASVAVHFYHPLVHWLARRLRLEQELAADALAAAVTGGEQVYLHTLAELALRQSERPLGWPAHTFLPTQGTFMRRIEMLRDANQGRAGQGWRWTRWMAVGVLIAGTIGVSGLRGAGSPPESTSLAQSEAPPQPAANSGFDAQVKKVVLEGQSDSPPKTDEASTPAAEPSSINLKYIPNDTILFLAIRPADLSQHADVASILTELDKNLLHLSDAGIPPAKLSQVTVILVAAGQGLDELVLVEGTEAIDFGKFASVGKHIAQRQDLPEYKSQTSGYAFARLSDSALIYGQASSVGIYLSEKRSGPASSNSEAWKLVSHRPVALSIDMRLVRALPEHQFSSLRQSISEVSNRNGSIWEETEVIVAGFAMDGQFQITLAADCLSKLGARGLSQGLDSIGWQLRSKLRHERQTMNQISSQSVFPRREPESVRILWDAVDKALSNVAVQQQDLLVTMSAEVELKVRGTSTLSAVIPSMKRAREAASKTTSANNARQIMLAMFQYHNAHKTFPSANGFWPTKAPKYPVSWRVQILPYLGLDDLFRAYHFDEPWDSDNNRKLLDQMPAIYRGPGDDPKSNSSAYYVLIGRSKNEKVVDDSALPKQPDPGTPIPADTKLPTMFSKYQGRVGIQPHEVLDGLSNTIAIIEAKRDIPWTKPEDITFDVEGKLPEFGGYFPDGFHIGLGDGSVRFILSTRDRESLRPYFTPAASEIVPAL